MRYVSHAADGYAGGYFADDYDFEPGDPPAILAAHSGQWACFAGLVADGEYYRKTELRLTTRDAAELRPHLEARGLVLLEDAFWWKVVVPCGECMDCAPGENPAAVPVAVVDIAPGAMPEREMDDAEITARMCRLCGGVQADACCEGRRRLVERASTPAPIRRCDLCGGQGVACRVCLGTGVAL